MPIRMCQTCNVKMIVDDARMAEQTVLCPMCAKGATSIQTPVLKANTTPMPGDPPTENLKDKIRRKVEEDQRRATTPQPGPAPAQVQEEKKPVAQPMTSGPKVIIRRPGRQSPPPKV